MPFDFNSNEDQLVSSRIFPLREFLLLLLQMQKHAFLQFIIKECRRFSKKKFPESFPNPKPVIFMKVEAIRNMTSCFTAIKILQESGRIKERNRTRQYKENERV